LSSVFKYYGKWFGSSAEDYSHTLVHIATGSEYKSLTGVGLDPKGKVVEKTEFQKQPGVAEKLWNYSAELTGINK